MKKILRVSLFTCCFVLLSLISNEIPSATGLINNRYASNQDQIEDEDKYITTKSGLKYYDILEGSGAIAETGDTLVVHYTAAFINGKVFDSSFERSEPFKFKIGAGMVLKGWDEGLLSMKVGGTRKLIIPPHLAYGENGGGNIIPPNATLIFEVKLFLIEKRSN